MPFADYSRYETLMLGSVAYTAVWNWWVSSTWHLDNWPRLWVTGPLRAKYVLNRDKEPLYFAMEPTAEPSTAKGVGLEIEAVFMSKCGTSAMTMLWRRLWHTAHHLFVFTACYAWVSSLFGNSSLWCIYSTDCVVSTCQSWDSSFKLIMFWYLPHCSAP